MVHQQKTVVLMLSVDVHPHLLDDLPTLIQTYLESEGILRVRNILWDPNSVLVRWCL